MTAGVTDAAPSSFQTAEKAVFDLINVWSKETFRLNRVLYDKDEMLCMLIERAVWHEVERLKEGMFSIKKLIQDQTIWLQRTEASLQRLLSDQVATRYRYSSLLQPANRNCLTVTLPNSYLTLLTLS